MVGFLERIVKDVVSEGKKTLKDLKDLADAVIQESDPDGGDDGKPLLDRKSTWTKRETTYRPYRSLVEPDDVHIYDSLHDALMRGETTVRIADSDSQKVSEIWKIVQKDLPQVYWVQKQFHMKISHNSITLLMEVTPNYEKRDELDKELDEYCQKLYEDEVQYCADDFEVALAVHDHLAKNVKYDIDEPERYTLIGPLLHGAGVCEGISEAYAFLMNKYGVKTGVYSGELGGHAHAWNFVTMNKSTYHVDVTNDMNCTHLYFGLSDTDMSKTHTYRRILRCQGEDCNYYIHTGSYVKDQHQLDKFVLRCRTEKLKSFEVKLAEGMGSDNIETAIKRVIRSITPVTYTIQDMFGGVYVIKF